jgi:hypothetical protein
VWFPLFDVGLAEKSLLRGSLEASFCPFVVVAGVAGVAGVGEHVAAVVEVAAGTEIEVVVMVMVVVAEIAGVLLEEGDDDAAGVVLVGDLPA